MAATADIVIIGAGIVGASVAWHLSRDGGAGRILILEREQHTGKGSTGKSMGGVRAQFSSELNICLSMYSIEFFRDYDEIVGHPSGYRPQGYLFLATSERHVEYLNNTIGLQRAVGLESVERLSTNEIVRRVPALRAGDILCGNFCATDGFVDPYSVMNGFLASAQEHGVELCREAEVTGLDMHRGFVRTNKGDISTRIVVNAAGAWSSPVAAMAGVSLPVEPLRRMLVPTEPTDLIPHSCPMVVDMTNGFHFRPEGPGLLMAWNDPEETPGYKTNFDPAFIEKILIRAANRVPGLEAVPVNPRRAWAGLYEMTPDHYPILGEDARAPGLFHATGFSGHGVMHSPATGRITSDLILHGRTEVVDAPVLNVSRFAQGRLLHEMAVL